MDGAPHVAGQDVQHRGGRGAKPDDLQIGVEEDAADVRAGQEVVEVVVELDELLNLLLVLGVDGVKLLVDRLELFVGALELLVRGQQLLVGGLELLVGGLQLLNGGLKALAGELQLLLQV